VAHGNNLPLPALAGLILPLRVQLGETEVRDLER